MYILFFFVGLLKGFTESIGLSLASVILSSCQSQRVKDKNSKISLELLFVSYHIQMSASC